MLIRSPGPCRSPLALADGRRRARRLAAVRAAGPALLAALVATGIAARAAEPSQRAPRPPDLVILTRSEGLSGLRQVGVYGAVADPRSPGLWSVQVWEETDDRVVIATDRIGCSTTAPMRITGSDGRLLVRELNPGGAIHPGNRLNHLI